MDGTAVLEVDITTMYICSDLGASAVCFWKTLLQMQSHCVVDNLLMLAANNIETQFASSHFFVCLLQISHAAI